MKRTSAKLICGIAALAAVFAGGCLSQAVGAEPDREIERLINQLPEIAEPGVGYSESFSASQFLPVPESGQLKTFIIGQARSKPSATVRDIVAKGAAAVPTLLAHLDDARTLKLPPMRALMWMQFADEYDFNRRTTPPPARASGDPAMGAPADHKVTVGDICFVALGQIVNRDFAAARYQPTGGLVVNSPTRSKWLCEQARNDWKDLTPARHQSLLADDLARADSNERRIGAYRRLAFYYPESIDPLVQKELSRPTYDASAAFGIARETLYQIKSEKKRKEAFEKFLAEQGPAAADGLMLQLFEDLDLAEATREGRLHPPEKGFKNQPRDLLVQLFGKSKKVKSSDVPYVDSVSVSAQALFIKALTVDRSRAIDETVYQIFARVKDDDALALACMSRLIGRGHDEELKAYCQRRIGSSKHQAAELNLVLAQLGKTPPAAGSEN